MNKHQYCFANISATEAPIFLKFYVKVNYLGFKFYEDSGINARTSCKHLRACFILSACVYDSCARICAPIFLKFVKKAHKIVIDHHIKFHKDPGFCCGDNCKQYWLSENNNFQCIFHIFTVSHLKSLTRLQG